MSLPAALDDSALWGWDPTPGIVSVWADRRGHAIVWRRTNDRIVRESASFRPWIVATQLDDLAHLGSRCRSWDDDSAAPVTYRELHGDSGSFRFLISARPGFALERALCDGASRRLGRSISSLYDLDDTYYGVGPVEQYLIDSGRVYFRGLRYDDLHRLQFDLETTALDPAQGRIFMVAIRDSRGLATTIDAATPDDEAALIERLCAIIRERDPDIIENHNLFGFDLPFLETRAAMLGVTLRLSREGGSPAIEHYRDPHRRSGRGRQRGSIPGRELIDTLDAVWRYDFAARELPSHRLKDVARHFGVASQERVYLAGESVYETFCSDPEQVRHYALDDVAEVDALSQRLLGAPFALAGMAPRRYERVASAGPAMGIFEPLLVRAYLHAGYALPANAAAESAADPHAGGATYLLAEGVAEHVVKADVASLYPSIMLTYRIAPRCDPLGVVLFLLRRLTDLRLQHKHAVRGATPGSTEAGDHMAQQAALKVVINSIYGYLGAGSMALFADRRAADEVTRRGRDILDRVIAELRARGTALLEADTDGVYFAVDPSMCEDDERALVAEVAATLPATIRLEYEGRYRSMLSHEVKNYALLRYDGTLIVRGVALRSSRSEPFGDRFLRDALRHTLHGDVPGAQAAFRATVDALRSRSLTAADVAARFRLAKSPEEYGRSRGALREQQYEALLAAGRTQWAVGERVRVYRADNGTSVWLPDETETDVPGAFREANERRDYDIEHYLQLLVNSYASRLKKAFAAEDWAQLFRLDGQISLFDKPEDQITPRWIRVAATSVPQSAG